VNDFRETSVLIIDDMRVNIIVLKKMLESDGHRVLFALNGPKGREIAENKRPDLILLDYMMPGEDGFQVIKKLKSNAVTHAIPVLFITSSEEIHIKVKAFELGALDYIIKPFHPEEVKARVRIHIRLSLTTRELIKAQTDKLRQIQDAQSAMLVRPDSLPEAKFGVFYKSLEEAGGDIYDVLQIGRDSFGYFVGDVCGHDIATGFITASIKALLKQNCGLMPPMESLRIANQVLADLFEDGKYLTACFAELNRLTNQLTLIGMGHPPTLFVPKQKSAYLIQIEGDILGAFPEVVFGQKQLRVNPGDRFFVYTDGLVEKTSTSSSWAMGMENLLSVADQLRSIPVQQVAEHLFSLLCGTTIPEDDVVILAAEV
jgi:sigma-B regulation protein RsbU (phosphoserine phosphatase)